MSEPLEIEVHATHLYPGAKGRVRGALAPNHASQPAVALFSDQATAAAELLVGPEGGHLLKVEPYRTARGADIAAKTWRVSLQGGVDDLAFRVTAREE